MAALPDLFRSLFRRDAESALSIRLSPDVPDFEFVHGLLKPGSQTCHSIEVRRVSILQPTVTWITRFGLVR